MTQLNEDWLARFGALGKGEPPAKKLAMLLRPAFVAERGKTLVWGDWSNIEARVLPWLAATAAAEEKLDIFRAVDKDPTLPDVYVRTAADLLGRDAVELWAAYKDETDADHAAADGFRQSHGKVPELSLGFGGGLGALQAMATNYGVYLDTATAKDMIARWRDANSWARVFWGGHGREGSYGLWGAINTAIENPDTICPAGRVAYVFDKSYLGGTVFCALPCGRLLTYPGIKWEWREVEDKKTKEVVDRYQLTFLKGYGRSALWYGKLAENVTQATAASVLRRALKRLDKEWTKNSDGSFSRMSERFPVVMHTHDEVVTEPREADAGQAAAELYRIMTENGEWDADLPLAAEVTTNWYYSKAVK